MGFMTALSVSATASHRCATNGALHLHRIQDA
jgi:hypothetical protein